MVILNDKLVSNMLQHVTCYIVGYVSSVVQQKQSKFSSTVLCAYIILMSLDSPVNLD